ncbi:MAG: 2,3-bisphosphoglycerate-independent phosphoglycerate mutase, partial [Janthinobacterium lividum]
MLVILDGFGWREEEADNAVRQARTPVFDRLWAHGPRAFLRTSGADVGLPDGQMGNSEVGHLNIGAGRVVGQELPRITAAIGDGSLESAPAMRTLVERLRASGGTCHLMGLVSEGGVHAHQAHGVALARILARAGVPAVMHAFSDGRDTAPDSGRGFLAALLRELPPEVKVASVVGRYFALDRDRRWDRVAKAYDAIVAGKGPRFADPLAVIDAAYAAGVGDEFVVPAVVGDYAGMQDGDGVLCFNFRADRVRELMAAIVDPYFEGFRRATQPPVLAAAAGMTRYSDDLAAQLDALFPPQGMSNLLGQVVSAAGRRQLRMAETEKYPHVTYFLNGGMELPLEGEERIMVPSPRVATYDLQPEMSAPELAERAVQAIDGGVHDLIVLNFANPDMVGHTGNLAATIRAIETVDAGLGRIAEAIGRRGGALLVTADHGNAEMMRDPQSGGPYTAHTTNLVPVVLAAGGSLADGGGVPDGEAPRSGGMRDGRLADLAPT